MLQRILVPLDGSSRAEQAVPLAARIARAIPDGRIVLVRVVSPRYEFAAARGALVRPTGIDAERLDTSAYLTRVSGWPVLSGIPTSCEIRWGPPAVAIVAAAVAHASDLIVMCSHGWTGPTRWALGSVAEQIVRHAPIPVLVLREHGSRLTGSVNGSHKPHVPHVALHVLVPLDGSPLAEEALVPAAQVARAVAGPRAVVLELVRVVSPYEVVEAHMQEAMAQAAAQAYLRRVAQRLAAGVPDIHVEWRVCAGPDVAYTILHGAETAGKEVAAGEVDDALNVHDFSPHYDLLAMSTHGRTGITRWATGSVTERVLQHSQLPLLVVRAHAHTDVADSMKNSITTETGHAGAPPAG